MAERKLTNLQRRFVDLILKGHNQTDAYEKAGYKCRGKTASEAASRLAKNVKIRNAIKAGQQKAAERAEITQKKILEEYGKIAFFNVKSLYDELGRLQDPKNMTDTVAAAVAEITVNHKKTISGDLDIIKRIKTYDKLKALDSLARIHGMFNDKLNLGLDAETLNAILSGLPEEYATAVREALGNLVSYKRG